MTNQIKSGVSPCLNINATPQVPLEKSVTENLEDVLGSVKQDIQIKRNFMGPSEHPSIMSDDGGIIANQLIEMHDKKGSFER